MPVNMFVCVCDPEDSLNSGWVMDSNPQHLSTTDASKKGKQVQQ